MGQIKGDALLEECVICSVNYLKSYQYKEALAMIHEAMQADDTSALVYNLLGIYYEMKGDYVRARKLYLVASALDASFLPAMNNLNRLTSYMAERTQVSIDFGNYERHK